MTPEDVMARVATLVPSATPAPAELVRGQAVVVVSRDGVLETLRALRDTRRASRWSTSPPSTTSDAALRGRLLLRSLGTIGYGEGRVPRRTVIPTASRCGRAP
jgi:hypothetical protein